MAAVIHLLIHSFIVHQYLTLTSAPDRLPEKMPYKQTAHPSLPKTLLTYLPTHVSTTFTTMTFLIGRIRPPSPRHTTHHSIAAQRQRHKSRSVTSFPSPRLVRPGRQASILTRLSVRPSVRPASISAAFTTRGDYARGGGEL
ncbi:uncharacterized protein IWZ02DRAFT_459841, partial [Phyllosticta citriasiana]|uniref:uncharacterized protein n=1 Tax=Phyllosticta citriasiana TaxID=595635 RepID=UPI0030FDDAEF